MVETIEKQVFEIDTLVDTKNNVLCVKDFETQKQTALTILENNKSFVVESKEDLKLAREIRAKLNKVVQAIDRRRIDDVNEFVKTYQDQCKEISELFNERQKEFGAEINKYVESQKETTTTKEKTITCVIKTKDTKVIEKLKTFCNKNNCELVIK